MGVALSTIRLGAGRDDAPVVLAVHGITATGHAWEAAGRALGERAALLAPDLRGRGTGRALGPPYGYDAHVSDLIATLDAAGLRQVVVAGHSLGAFVACRLAVAHPDRVRRLVLVDGGVPFAGGADIADPDATIEATLGPAAERLRTEFADLAAMRAWWDAHPAFAGSDVDPDVLDAYVAADATGEPPRLRSSVDPAVLIPDGRDALIATDGLALECEAVLLHAPAGLTGGPDPMQEQSAVADWVAGDPERRRAELVPGTNHYTVLMGERGAQLVADEIAAAASGVDGGPMPA